MQLKKTLSCLVLALSTALVSTSFMAIPTDADAARMGGGRSFGSHPSMSAPAPRPVAPMTHQSTTQRQTNGMSAATAPRSGGLFGGFGGGMLGGFLAGSLLGSLFGGHGGMAAGAEGAGGGGLGLFDILLFGLVIWLGVKLFRRRAQANQESAQSSSYDARNGNEGVMNRSSFDANTGWGSLSSHQESAPSADYNPNVPEGFDTEEFLRGAKMVYTRMQSSWDRRDLNDIAQFATDSVVAELRRQMADDPTPGQTQILLVNATLAAVTEFGAQDRADVYFDVMMREDMSQPQPERVMELWHFVRAHGTNDSWKLDGIQQVE